MDTISLIYSERRGGLHDVQKYNIKRFHDEIILPGVLLTLDFERSQDIYAPRIELLIAGRYSRSVVLPNRTLLLPDGVHIVSPRAITYRDDDFEPIACHIEVAQISRPAQLRA